MTPAAARVFRWVAVAIVVAGVIDPAVTTLEPFPPTVSVRVSGEDPADSALADRVADVLERRATVVRGPSATAAAVVAVGDRVPAGASAVSAPVFAILPEPIAPAGRVTDVVTPHRAPLDSRVPVDVHLETVGLAQRAIEVTLETGGVEVDRADATIEGDPGRAVVRLAFVPSTQGLATGRVTARLDGTTLTAADFAVDVAVRRWRVLVFDRRPSWMSTFVRRSLEDDPRFDVDARTVTSRTAAIGTTDAPANLADPAALAGYAAIVIGAPESLTAADASSLERYLRERGGAVIALMDSPPEPNTRSAVDHWLGINRWHARAHATPITLAAAATGEPALVVSEIVWPDRLPPGGHALVVADASDRPPIVWQAPVGAGRVIVSGALDAWRHRTSEDAGFHELWRGAIANAAAASPDPVDLRLDRTVLRPGDSTTAGVVLRDAALSPDPATAASITAFVEGPDGRAPLRFWPTGAPGQLAATLTAGEAPGHYRLTVTSDDGQASAGWLVAGDARTASPAGRSLIEDWARSRGGRTFTDRELSELAAAIDGIDAGPERESRWHPMRHPWWIAALALLLGVEWWTRRRAGLA